MRPATTGYLRTLTFKYSTVIACRRCTECACRSCRYSKFILQHNRALYHRYRYYRSNQNIYCPNIQTANKGILYYASLYIFGVCFFSFVQYHLYIPTHSVLCFQEYLRPYEILVERHSANLNEPPISSSSCSCNREEIWEAEREFFCVC
jgi:hypothetical protein